MALSGIRPPAVLRGACACAAALLAAWAPLRAAEFVLGRRDATLRLDAIAWQWTNPGERPWRDEILADVDPRGELLLVASGKDERRLLLLRRGAEPIVVSRAFFELRPPRFAPDGSAFFFSATYGEHARDGVTRLRAGVFRADRDGRAARLYPPPAAAADAGFGLLLDVSPAGGALLIGTGAELDPLLVPHGGYDIEAAELDLATGGVRPLGVRLNARAPAFYRLDGGGFFFHAEPPLGRLHPLTFHDFATGSRTARPWNVDSGGAPAGDFLAWAEAVRHLGAFREEDFPIFLIGKTARGPRVRLELSGPLAALQGRDAALRAVRGGAALFSHGRAGEETYTIAEVPRARLASLLAEYRGRDVRYTPLRLFFGEAPPAAAELLSAVRAALAPPPLPPEAIAVYTRESLDPGFSFRQEITAAARADGALVIRFTPTQTDGPPAVEWSRDAGVCRRSSAEGTFQAPQRDLGVHEAAYSPYGLLLDPAGLLDPEIRFAHPRAEGDRIALPFSYADGYRGTLFLDTRSKLPREITSPLNFIVAAHAAELGLADRARSLRIEAWRREAGRLVPAAMVFHDGAATFRLTLESLRAPSGDGLPSPAGIRR